MTFFWLISGFLICISVVIFIWFRERRYLKKKVSEVMSDETWSEITEERELAMRKQRLFKATLESEIKKMGKTPH